MLQTKAIWTAKKPILMFVNDVISSRPHTDKTIKGFEKVFIKAGETVTVNLKLNIQDLAIVTRDLKYIVEKASLKLWSAETQKNI